MLMGLPENKKKKMRFAAGIVECLLCFAIVFITVYADLFYSLDSALKDKLYQSPRGINNNIKIIAIDDKTLEKLGPFGTWSRSVYADLIDSMGDNPAVIAMDIMFFGNIDEEGDEALRAACEKNGNVVAGSYINYTSKYTVDENGKPFIDHFNIESVTEPFFAEYCDTGFVNVSPDDDGIVRSAMMYDGDASRDYESLSSVIYSKYCERTGRSKNSLSLDSNGRMWINYAGRPGDYEHISFSDVIEGKVDPRIFKDCIVFVGAYASGLQDQYSVPNSSAQMFGVEIHANILQGIIDNRMPLPIARITAALICAALCTAVYLLSRKAKIKISLPITIVALVGFVFCGIMLNDNGLTIPLAYCTVFIPVAFLFNLVRHYAVETLEKRRITAAFKKYVAPQVVDEIFKKGGYQIKLGGENRHIAVLFVDIRGFTPMSEALEPEQVVDILNSYLNLTTNSIFKNGGTLDKFIGDATMAVFNAPFDLDDYIFRAVKTAWDIVQGGNEIESKFMEKYGRSVGFGVGVNCGNAVVGNIGCDFRMDYTAIGDTVNTAARLEANAKRGQVLISESVYEQVKDRVEVEPIGEIPLKGKAKGVFVYSLLNIKTNEDDK